MAQKEVWEDRKIRHNGNTLYVNVPKNWAEALDRPAAEIFRVRIIFEIKDGKPSVRLQE